MPVRSCSSSTHRQPPGPDAAFPFHAFRRRGRGRRACDSRLWAPTAREVALVLGEKPHAMPAAESGWRRLTVPEARAGDRYRYRIDGGLMVPDPASRFQPDDITGPSRVVDPRAFDWSDGAWTGRPWEEAVLYEVHVGTATPEGTYAGLAEKLEELRDLGVTAIELMPLADFPGRRNWGYDGVLPFAPDSSYGAPDDLKRLVDRAHGLGLMMFLDVVYNHFGPAGNYLHAYAKSFFTERHQTPWGAGINFDGAGREAGARLLRPQRAVLARGISLRRPALRRRPCDPRRQPRAHHRRDRRARCGRRCPAGRSISCSRTKRTRRAGSRATPDGRSRLHTAQWNDDLHHCWHALAHRRGRRLLRGLTPMQPVERLGACARRGLRLPGRAFAPQGRGRAARARRICRPPPSSPSSRTTTRSATAPSASASPNSPPRSISRSPGPASCSRRRFRCSTWARNGRPRRRSCSSSISPTIPSCRKRCATGGDASSRTSRASPSSMASAISPTRRPRRPSGGRCSTGPRPCARRTPRRATRCAGSCGCGRTKSCH